MHLFIICDESIYNLRVTILIICEFITMIVPVAGEYKLVLVGDSAVGTSFSHRQVIPAEPIRRRQVRLAPPVDNRSRFQIPKGESGEGRGKTTNLGYSRYLPK